MTRAWFINLLVVVALACFFVGISAPVLTLKKLVFVETTFSLLSGIRDLWLSGQHALATLIALFSMALPVVKLALLVVIVNFSIDAKYARVFSWLHRLGRWSMLDVFVVAVLFASIKLGALADTEVHYGLYVFAVAVVMTMLATELAQR